MEESFLNQGYVFLTALLCGLAIGLVFDCLRIFRRVLRIGKIGIAICDTLFWIIATGVMFAYVFITNSGQLRMFEFVGVGLALLLYNLLFSGFIVKCILRVIETVKKITVLIIRIILTPAMWIYRLLRRPMIIVIGSGRRTGKRLRRFIRGRRGKIMNLLKKIKQIANKI